jgi:uncharacterized repeat protein (TIGR01451 family)
VTGATFKSNTASGGGSASFSSAAMVTGTTFTNNLLGIVNFGTLTLNNSTVGGNTSGGINNFGILTLNNTTVSGNAGPGVGGISNRGTMTMTNSTVSGNTGDGGIGNYFGGTVTLNNSTVSGNTSSVSGGGITNGDGGTLTLNNSTVSGNQGYFSGGVMNFSTTVLQNTILAGNTGNPTSTSPDCSGTINSSGYNLIGNTAGCTFNATTGDLLNVNPKLDPLQNNGGPTPTHALLLGSPAINAGNPAGCTDQLGNPLASDQRGFPRVSRCDIGAYEVQPIAFSTKAVNPSLASPGNPLVYTIVLTNSGSSPLPNVMVTDTLPSSLNYTINSLTATSGSYNYNSGVITWTGSVNASANVNITFGAVVSQTAPIGDLVNAVIINGGAEIITRTATANIMYRVYLPLIRSTCKSGICGRVTLNGSPAAGVSLELRFFNGSSFSTLATTTTNANGDYAFAGMPSLALGQHYYVRYRNYAGTPGRLWVWGTRDLTSYSAGSAVEIGNFDIADIVLVSPAAGATVALPYTFQWTRRPATPSDTYEFDLYDPTDGNPNFYTAPPLGYVGSYILNSLPPGFNVGALYGWEIWVYSPDGGYGISYETRAVHFSNTGLSVTTAVQPARYKTAPDLEDRRKR